MAKTPEKITYTKGDVTIETSDVGEGVRLRAEGFRAEGFRAETPKGKSPGGQSNTGSSSGSQGRSQS